MKRRKQYLAVVLSAMLAAGAMQVPVMAAGDVGAVSNSVVDEGSLDGAAEEGLAGEEAGQTSVTANTLAEDAGQVDGAPEQDPEATEEGSGPEEMEPEGGIEPQDVENISDGGAEGDTEPQDVENISDGSTEGDTEPQDAENISDGGAEGDTEPQEAENISDGGAEGDTEPQDVETTSDVGAEEVTEPQDVETTSDGGAEGAAEPQDAENIADDSAEDIEEGEPGPAEELPQEDEAEVWMGSLGSVSGDSTITWSTNTMPVAFDITSIDTLKRAYIEKVDDGYLRVAYDGQGIIIEYYDEAFDMTRQGRLSMELDVWGGFFKGSDAYYIAEGHYNTDCQDDTEVLRIIKYDFDWNRIGAGRVLAKEGWTYEIRFPFDAGCVNMDEVNGKLYLITGREGYVDENYGQGHQGMMLIRMDETTFDTEIVYGDFWHSFAQYMGHSGQDLYICELSEGSRCTSLSRFDTNRTGTDYFDAFSETFSVLDYGGSRTSAWAIACYASVDDMEVSADNVLCLGTSIDQSQYDNVSADTPHNIYLTVTPKSNLDAEHTVVRWLTDFTGGGKSFIGTNITKINENRFMVAWELYPDEDNVTVEDYGDTLSSGELHYIFVNGAGEIISSEFTARAMLSDCEPVFDGRRIVYYASKANCLDFYAIDAQTGEFQKKVIRIAGENISWDYKSGILSFSGEGDIAVDLEAYHRYAVSRVASGYVYSSGDNCWMDVREAVTGLKIGKGITSIPERAFAFFDDLEEVTLPDGLKSIGKEAFYSCDALRELRIPDSVDEIGEDILWTGYYWTSDDSHVTYATIYGGCQSYAMEYAKENDIYYVAEHKWVSELTAPATTEENGVISKKCSACGTTVTEEVYYPETIKLSKTSLTYNGKAQKPKVTVTGADGKKISANNYTLKYSSGCTEPGTYTVKITFKGNYSGSVKKKFKIVKAKPALTAEAAKDVISVGKTTKLSVSGAEGGKTFASSDKTIATVDKNGKVTGKKVGTVDITVTSVETDHYKEASQTVTIKVVPGATSSIKASNLKTGIKLTWKKVAGANGYYVYRDNEKIAKIKGGATVTYTDKEANKNGQSYTYKIVAKGSTGKSKLSKTLVACRVSRPAVSSVKNSKAGKMTVKWKKNSKASGYQIQYSTDAKFKTASKKVDVKKAATVSRGISGLKKGKTYYVRIRTYRTVDGKTYWSAWSPAKSIAISK